MGSPPSEHSSDDTENLSSTARVSIVEGNLYVMDQAQYLGLAAKPRNETGHFSRINKGGLIPTPKVIAYNEIDLYYS